MKEPEEAKKLLEEAFEEAQYSYLRAMERGFAVQMLTLEFASPLLDSKEDEEIRPEEKRELLRGLYRNFNKAARRALSATGASARSYTEVLHSVFSIQSPRARKFRVK